MRKPRQPRKPRPPREPRTKDRYWKIQREWIRTLSPSDLPPALHDGERQVFDVPGYLNIIKAECRKADEYDYELNKRIKRVQESALKWAKRNFKRRM